MRFFQNIKRRNPFLLSLILLFIFCTNFAKANKPWEGDVDTDWYNNLRVEFELLDPAQLAGLASIVNDGTDDFTDKVVTIKNTMDLGRLPWTPIGTKDHPFNGCFEGSGNIIEGLNVSVSSGNAGLFGYTGETSRIKNLGISCNSTFSGSQYVGAISAQNEGEITLCYNKGAILSGNVCGGIVGENLPTGNISYCYNVAQISSSSNGGGITGICDGIIFDCYNIGEVASNGNAGGITGTKTTIADIQNCFFATSSSLNGAGSGDPVGMTLVSHSDLQNPTFIYYLRGNSWTEDGANLNNGYPIFLWQTLTSPEKTYTITASIKGAGSISPSGIVSVCLDQTFTFTPAECYEIHDVIIDGVPIPKQDISSSYTFENITSNHTISVEYSSSSTDTINVTFTNGGTISIGDSTISEGDIVICEDKTFYFTPNDCYTIKEVLINGSPNNDAKTEGKYTFKTGNGFQKLHVEFRNVSTGSIASSAAGGGIIFPKGDSIPVCGKKTFTIEPDPCYKIQEVYVDGDYNEEATLSGTYTFENVFGNHSIYATFEPKHTLIVHAGPGGTATHTTLSAACEGERIAFYPDPCYIIKDVVVNGVSKGGIRSYLLETVDSDIEISVSFEQAPMKTHTIFCSTVGGGTVSPGGRIYINTCEDTTLTFTPDRCYIIDDVEVDSVSIGPVSSYTFVGVAENHSIRVTFKETGYSLILASNDFGGKITPFGENNDGIISGKFCNDTTFYIKPEPCYAIKDVVVDGISIGPVTSYTFKNLTGDHTINAAFTRTYRIEASCEGNGTIEPSGLVLGRLCTDTTFTVKTDSCHEVTSLIVDGINMGPITSYTFKDIKTIYHSIEAKVALQTRTITAGCNENGTLIPNGTIKANKCTDTTIYFYPYEGYIITEVIVDGDTIDIDSTITSYTFHNITDAHSIYVVYKPNWYIDATADQGGKIEPSGRKYFEDPDDTQTYIITPLNKFTVKNVIVNNISQGPLTEYTFENIRGKQQIHAEFIRIFTLNSTCSEHGTIVPLGEKIVKQGDTVKYTITPDQGYYAKIYINGFEIANNLHEYTFENISKDQNIHVDFLEGSSIPETIISNISLYPNPTKTNCTIAGELLTPAKDIKIIISDLNGKTIKEIVKNDISVGAFNYTFDVSNLITGTYNISINVDNTITMKKLIIER